MLNDEYFKQFIDSKGRINPASKLNNLTEDEINYLHNRFNDSTSVKETIHRIYNGIEEKPKCIYCQNSCRPKDSQYKTYFETCDNKVCMNKHGYEQRCKALQNTYGVTNPFQLQNVKDIIKEKRESQKEEIVHKTKQTCLQRYGVDNGAKTDVAKQKSIQTCLEKYGTEYSFQSENNKSKAKQTCLERYGCEYAVQSNIVKNKIKQTCLERYGVDNIYKNIEIQNKAKNTLFKHYGVTIPLKSQEILSKAINTCLYRYGVCLPSKSQEIKEKIKETQINLYEGFFNKKLCLEKYGCEYPIQSNMIKNKIKQTLLNIYGVNHIFQLDTVREKAIETKKKNHTLNTSKPEKEIYKLLINKYTENDILTQYKSDVYPYHCDFYIKSLNMYLECNFHWTHGPHPFDKNNVEDIALLNKWKNKNTNFYINAIKTWTIRDINKFNIAKQNNLNYKAFYTLNECKQFIENSL